MPLEINLPSIKEQKIIVKKLKAIETEENELKQEITQQQALLKKLRQQILQEAIEGKLTQDWRVKNPNTEPASKLLKRIQAEKQQLIKDKKIKAQKPLPAISEDEKPFKLPDSWVWCRLGKVIKKYEAGKSFKCIDRGISHTEWGVIKTSAITSSVFKEEKHKFYQKNIPKDTLKQIKNGDLIFCRASGTKGYAGKCCLVVNIHKNLLLSDKTPRVTIYLDLIEKEYVCFHNETKHTMDYYSSLNTGKSTSMNNITKQQLLEKPLPLPPLSEQKAIVAKVEKLLNICDKLQTQITANQIYAEQLMQAVLKEAFTQAEQPI
ncbi:Type I restriction-modification system, specificity subunit S [uncultured Candidatus Thioglobus sp.]|nr:Type I restriction-modification system, specificity subunit S [uncultured Candidatus Thioglobus sp.]